MIRITIWAITRLPGNPIPGRGAPINEIGVIVEAMQIIFIGLTAAILVMETRTRVIDEKHHQINGE